MLYILNEYFCGGELFMQPEFRISIPSHATLGFQSSKNTTSQKTKSCAPCPYHEVIGWVDKVLMYYGVYKL